VISRGPIDRAHGWRGANVRMSRPPPCGAIHLAPTGTPYKKPTHTPVAITHCHDRCKLL